MLCGVLRHAGSLERFLELLDFRSALAGFSEFFLDLAHLLAQHVFALALIERLAGCFADPRGDTQHFDAFAERFQNTVQPLAQIEAFEQCLLLLGAHIHEIDHEVRQRCGRAHVLDHAGQFSRRLWEQTERVRSRLLELMKARRHVGIVLVAGSFNHGNARHEERPALQEFEYAKPLLPLHDDLVHAFRAGDVAQDVCIGTHPMEIQRRGVVLHGIALQQKTDTVARLDRILHRRHRAVSPECHRRHDPRKQNHVAQRNDGDRILRQRLFASGANQGCVRTRLQKRERFLAVGIVFHTLKMMANARNSSPPSPLRQLLQCTPIAATGPL